jgi:hypothetical protein
MQGKHPVHARWQTGHLMSRPDVMATWDPDAGGEPAYNIGILTGVATGERPFFVLDIDPDNGGYETLARLEAEHGPLPRTRTHRTGSGGEHRLFLVPDGMTIRNNQKRLGPGVDIRGVGGMIVAPPSVSGKGEYELIAGSDDGSGDRRALIGEPPTWLVELLTVPAGMEALPTVVAEDLPDYASLDMHVQTRVQAYALKGVRGAADDYFNAPVGRGNDTLYRSAAAAIEIAQSPWNLITVDDVIRELDAVRVRRNAARPGGGQEEREFMQTVRSAHSAVVGQGRPVPPDPHPIDRLAADHLIPPDLQLSSTGDGVTTQEVPDGLPVRTMTLAERIRAALHTRSELEALEPPTPLIEGVADVGTMVVLAGQFGTFKSFTTVGWACSVATGTPWMGRAVPVAKPVLYVAAEGASGIKLRVRAWEVANGVTVPDHMLITLALAINIGDDNACRELLTVCREFSVGMVIFDTLHRVTGGLDENSSKDMHRVTHVADALREALNATTVYAHHTGHGGARSRGASSIEDDADCVWVTRLTGDQGRDPNKPRQFEQRKTKDSPLIDPFFVKLDLVNGTDSGVLIPVDDAGIPISVESIGDPFRQPRQLTAERRAERQSERDAIKNENAGLILDLILDVYLESGQDFTEAAVRTLAFAQYGGRSGWGKTGRGKTFGRAWGRLIALGVIEATTTARFRYVPVADRQPLSGTNQE